MPRYALSRNPVHGTHYVVDMTGGQALTEAQLHVLVHSIGTPQKKRDQRNGVYRSLVIRGLLGTDGKTTPQGKDAVSIAMRATPTRLSREHEDKSRAEKTLAHYRKRGHEHFRNGG